MIKVFICQGWCSRSPGIIEPGEPPKQITKFEGTYQEAILAGWSWSSDIRFSPNRNAVPICPDCAKQFKGGK